jgi:cyclin C
MSANYWESTQRQHWLFTKDQLASMRQKLDDDSAEWVRSYPLPEQRHLAIFFNQREFNTIALSKTSSDRMQSCFV